MLNCRNVMNVKKKLKATLALLLSMSPILVQAETVWIDVRSAAEHTLDNIDGDILISHVEIVDEISQRFPDIDTKIHLYCRSGNRAEIAKSALNQVGYTNVLNEGSIENARKIRGL